MSRSLAVRQHSVAPDAYWHRELQVAFGKPNAKISWLQLFFHPVWERWVIYQMVPAKATSAFILRDPEAGAPLLNVERDLMDLGQRQLYDATGYYGSALWVIQGHAGGHRRRFWPYERTMAEMAGLPGELPAPGALPYAEMDQRVMDQLHQLDLVSRWNKTLEFCDRNHAQMEGEELQGQREVRKKLWAWVQEQVGNAFEGLARQDIQAALEELPHGLGKSEVKLDYDEWLERKMLPQGTILT